MGRVGRRATALGDLRDRAHDRSHGRAAIGLNHDLLARVGNGIGWKIAEEEGLRASNRGQFHRDEPRADQKRSRLHLLYGRLGMDGLEI